MARAMSAAPLSESEACSPYSIPTKSSTARSRDSLFSFINHDNARKARGIPTTNHDNAGSPGSIPGASGPAERGGYRGGRGAPRQLAGGVEMPQGLGVRLEQGGLAVGHLVRRAERGDQRLGSAQA